MNLIEQVRPAPAGTRILLRCMGRFALENRAGDQLKIRTRKARAAIAVVALSGRPMSRDALADLLWSDRCTVQAKSSVRQTLFELQHLDAGAGAILIASRDHVAIRNDVITTDLELIRSAANEDDWSRLTALLAASDPGLLTDLDGLDSELDAWLRNLRAHEPSTTLNAAVAAAQRCKAESGPRAALELVLAITRLDPLNEEAARIALAIYAELGDHGGLHRQFYSLQKRLLAELDAEPSPETVALFDHLAAGRNSKPPNGEAGAAESGSAQLPAIAAPAASGPRAAWPRRAGVLAVLIAVGSVISAAMWSGSPEAAVGAERPLVAVLPFEQQSSGDRFLAEGLWEDTRIALSRNSGLRVLGRSTARATAEDRLTPDQLRTRLGVDYLLEGSVRRSADQLLVSVSLTRTADGIAVWDGSFRGRMDEPLVMQYAIANGIEGKLRGRLARGGGRRAEQIATTPETFALYSEARQLVASRRGENMQRAEALLRKAVATDPNFAPAWSSLATAIFFNNRGAIENSSARGEALSAARRSLALAPNLAQAHATVALLEGDNAPSAEQALRRAVALDANDAEAWTWLGNALVNRYRYGEAVAAYERAIAVDPLWSPAVQNLSSTAIHLQDRQTFDRLVRRVTRAGAGRDLITSLRADDLSGRGDYSGAMRLLLQLGRDAQGRAPAIVWSSWMQTLTGLGYYHSLHEVTGCPDWYAPLLRGERLPPETFEGRAVTGEEFFTSLFFSHAASRAMVNLKRERQLVQLYRAGFGNADEFISRTTSRGLFTELAPTLAIALSATGSQKEALYILSAAANELQSSARQAASRDANIELAAVRAAQGEREQALRLLDRALQRGWLPDGRMIALDLHQEPAFRGLRNEPRFAAARRRILAHIAKERAELGPVTL